MKLLAIETATEACSAALLIDGEVTHRQLVAPREHARLILPMCEELLAAHGLSVGQLDALAFGRGPGSFTGVRIATGIIQGMAYATGLPVVPVSTLAAIAQQVIAARDGANVIAAIDARMGEIYWGCYRCDERRHANIVGDEQLGKPQSISESISGPEDAGWYGAGSGWQTYGEQLATRLSMTDSDYDGAVLPHARDVATLALAAFDKGLAVSAVEALPVYLRNKVADKPRRP